MNLLYSLPYLVSDACAKYRFNMSILLAIITNITYHVFSKIRMSPFSYLHKTKYFTQVHRCRLFDALDCWFRSYIIHFLNLCLERDILK